MNTLIKLSLFLFFIQFSVITFGQITLKPKISQGLWGFTDAQKKVIIEYQYQKAYPFVNDIAAVKKNGLWGFINTKNEVIRAFQYSVVKVHKSSQLILVQKNKKWALFDLNLSPLTGFKFDKIGVVRNKRLTALKGQKWGLLDNKGKKIISFKYDNIHYTGLKMVLVQKNNKWGYLGYDGKKKIAVKYDEIGKFYGSRTKAKKKGKWGIIDRKGKKIVDFKFGFIGQYKYDSYLEDMYAPYTYKNRFGKISTWGAAIPFRYDEVIHEEKIASETLKTIRIDKVWGAVNLKGELVIPLVYQNPIIFSEGLAAVKKNGKFGYIDPLGKVIIPFKYNQAEHFKDGKATISLNSKEGIVEKNGKELFY